LVSEGLSVRYLRFFGNAAADPKSWKMFPVALQEQLADQKVPTARTTADYIASMGEQRAVELYAELVGASLKPVVTGLPL
jgi:dGTP triphosphohydrolase